jgi:hypothetical protein
MVDKLLNIFEQNLKKHITTRWITVKMIVYLLGGEPELAKQFARTLVYWNGDAESKHWTDPRKQVLKRMTH